MVMVGVDSDSLYRRTHSLSRLAWTGVGGRSNELGELSQWLCHDDSTMDIVLELLFYYSVCWVESSTLLYHTYAVVSFLLLSFCVPKNSVSLIFSTLFVLISLVMLQVCREAQNSDKAEVESLQATIDQLKNEIEVSKSYCRACHIVFVSESARFVFHFFMCPADCCFVWNISN